MSSSNVSLILSELSATRADVLALKSEVSSLRAALAAKTASAPAVASGKPVAEKKPRKKSDAPPTAWRLFTDRVRALLKDNGYTAKAVGVECVQFCSTLKGENADFDTWVDADILARRTGWSAPEVSKQKAAGKSWRKSKTGSAPASVVSGGDDEELDDDAPAASSTDKPKKERKNPWAGLTPEQRAAKSAAMKAGRDAKKAAASADSGDAPVTESAPVSPPPRATSSSTNAASSAAVAVTSVSVSGPAGFKKVALNGERFWVNLESGHAYYRLADESQGEWAGLFSKTPKPNVDKSAPEPSADDDDEFAIDE